MPKTILCLLFLIVVASAGAGALGAAGDGAAGGRGAGDNSPPVKLRCEHLTAPLGIGTAAPRLSWQLNDRRAGAKQTAWQVMVFAEKNVTGSAGGSVADNAATGATGSVAGSIAGGAGAPVWDSGKVADDATLVRYAGPPLAPFTRYVWRVRVWDAAGNASPFSAPEFFETAAFNPNTTDTTAGTTATAGAFLASWISDGHDKDFRPAALFRREFTISPTTNAETSTTAGTTAAAAQPLKARLHITAGGLYEVFINGVRVGDRLLEPLYTRYDKRNLYATHDVSALLKNGRNVIGVCLGNGWYNPQARAIWNFHNAPWRNRPRFALELRIKNAAGSVEIIRSDATWKTAAAPLIYNNIYTGEHYDARLEKNVAGWNTPNFNDAAWAPATPVPAPAAQLVAQQAHPVRATGEFRATEFRKINDKTFLYIFPKQLAGVTRFTAKAPAGTRVEIKHGEQLDAQNKRLNNRLIAQFFRPTKTSDDPFQTDRFFFAGTGGAETFQARFNYKGFSIVEVTSSAPLELDAGSVVAIETRTDFPAAGGLKTSDELTNKILFAARNSYLSNFVGIPTDCPHREKNGWTADAHRNTELGLFNFDAVTLYEKWLDDHLDAQRADGLLPGIIPSSGWGYGNEQYGTVDWVASIAFIPWDIFLFTGDASALAKTYEAAKKYVAFQERKSKALEKQTGAPFLLKDALGDWNAPDFWTKPKTRSNPAFIATIHFHQLAKILARTAVLLGKKDDAARYAKLAENIKDALNKKWLDRATGVYCNGTQTELSAALCFDVVPPELKEKTVAALVARIDADGGHWRVGMLGVKTLLNALSENGHADLAFRLLTQTTFPSIGYYISKGGTSLYEEWFADTKREASLNHPCWGECGAWLYKALAGIRPDPSAPGFKHFILRPNFVRALDFVEAWHETPHGKIESKWRREKTAKKTAGNTAGSAKDATAGTTKIIWEFTIPPNTTATIFWNGEAREFPAGKHVLNVSFP